MRKLFALLNFMLLFSCADKQTPPPKAGKEPARTSLATVPFKKIPYDFNYTMNDFCKGNDIYFDSIARSINPDKKYQYWAYVAYGRHHHEEFYIVKEGGDTLARRGTDSLPGTLGFFHGGHPNFTSCFAVVVENDSLRYIGTATAFRNFLGTIDNLDEAVLAAATYDYNVTEGSVYRIVNGKYQLQARKSFKSSGARSHLNTFTITKKGFVKITPDETNTQ